MDCSTLIGTKQAKIWNEVIFNHKTILITHWIGMEELQLVGVRLLVSAAFVGAMEWVFATIECIFTLCTAFESLTLMYPTILRVLMHTEWMCIFSLSFAPFFILFGFIFFSFIFVNFNCWHFFYSNIRLVNFFLDLFIFIIRFFYIYIFFVEFAFGFKSKCTICSSVFILRVLLPYLFNANLCVCSLCIFFISTWWIEWIFCKFTIVHKQSGRAVKCRVSNLR